MPNAKISELPDGGALQASDQIPIVRSGSNFRASNLFAGVAPVVAQVVGDGIRLRDAAINSGSPNLVSATAVFSQADVGKSISVVGAGVAKGRTVNYWRVDGTITSGTKNLVSATGNFQAADVGKAISIMGAGTGGIPHDSIIDVVTDATHVTIHDNAITSVTNSPFNYQGSLDADLKTTIASVVDSTHITLSANAGASVSGASFAYGTNDTAAIQAAIASAASAGGGMVSIPPKTIYLATSVTLVSGVSISGVTANSFNPTFNTALDDEWDTVNSHLYFLANKGGTVFIGPSDLAAFTYASSSNVVTGIDFGHLGADGIQTLFKVGAVDQRGAAWCHLHDLIVFNNRGGYAIDICNSQHVQLDFIRGLNVSGGLQWTALFRSAVSVSAGNSMINGMMFGQGPDGDYFPGIHVLGDGGPMAGPQFYCVQNNRLQATALGHAVPNMWFHGSLRTVGSVAQSMVTRYADLEGNCNSQMRFDNTVNCDTDVTGIDTTHSSNSDIFIRNSGQLLFRSSVNCSVNYDGVGGNLWFGLIQSFTNQQMPGPYILGNGNYLGLSVIPGYARLAFDYGQLNLTADNGMSIKNRVTDFSNTASIDQVANGGCIRLVGNNTYTLTLPTPAAYNSGVDYSFVKAGAGGTVTLSTPSGVIGYGGASTNAYLDTQGKAITLRSDGTNWGIVSKN